MVRLVVIDRAGNTVDVDAQAGISTMENIRDLEASVDAICGGMCACATCHILVDEAWQARLPPRTYEEDVMLRDSRFFDEEQSRLSCQLVVEEVYEGLQFRIAPED
jgi:2Fe-2S ferredoxin